MPESTSFDVRKVDNGFVISAYGPKGQKTYIAKNKAERDAITKKLLGIK